MYYERILVYVGFTLFSSSLSFSFSFSILGVYSNFSCYYMLSWRWPVVIATRINNLNSPTHLRLADSTVLLRSYLVLLRSYFYLFFEDRLPSKA